jgi:hypothetical protein
MSERRDGHTPKSYARSEVITAIFSIYRYYERNPDEIDGSPAFRDAVMKQLAKIHNRMLDESGLNGLHIGE